MNAKVKIKILEAGQQFALPILGLLALFSVPTFAADPPAAPPAEPGQLTIAAPSPAAFRIFETIDAMNVEKRCPVGQHVDWETEVRFYAHPVER